MIRVKFRQVGKKSDGGKGKKVVEGMITLVKYVN